MATTTNYGWETPDDTDLVKDGALAQRTTGNAIDSTLYAINGGTAPVGLQFIKSQSIGSGVTSVTVTNAFSSTYSNYLITFTGYYNSGNDAVIQFKLNNSANYITAFTTTAFSGGAVAGTGSTSNGNGAYVALTNQNIGSFSVQVFNPFDTTRSQIVSSGNIGAAVALVAGIGGALDSNSSTNFTLNIGSAQTITGGTIRVYGIRN